jgi:hypothetical protein
VGVNYADHPKSIGEIRSDKSQDCKDWTPRDVLIDLLREIDAGTRSPTALVLCWAQQCGEAEAGFSTHYSASAITGLHALGLLTRCIHRMNIATD